jgi:beta-barrel assembly-enhancing protease
MRIAFSLLLVSSLVIPGNAWDWNQVDLDKAASGGAKLLKAASGMKDADEIRLGREVAANLAARYDLIEDQARLKYINLVGQALVHQSNRSKLPFHFGILKAPEYNAFAAPGGYVFITEGLLSQLRDEAELAGVLAHEISHITERHVVKAIRDANLLGAGKDLAAAAGHDAEDYASLTDFSVHLLEKGFSRKDELQADRLGTELAAKTGYDPRGLRDSVARLAEHQEKDPILARFKRTHPPTQDRLDAINKVLPKKLSESLPRLPERYKLVFANTVPAK